MSSVNRAYKVKLYPTRVKSDMLGMLCSLFQQLHHQALDDLASYVAKEGKLVLKGKSQAGRGEFAQRVRRRAYLDWQRARKAARATKRQMKIPYLRAEICDAAEVQETRKAKGFDSWVHIEGLSRDCQLYLPVKKHKALNRALERPEATLSRAAQVFRKNDKWYAWVYVKCPLQPVYKPKGWYGNDVGIRASITRSDGYQGPDLRPILKKQKERQAERQRQGCPADFGWQTPQRQALAREAKKLVSVALASGRGIVLEDPKRLPRWKQWAARYLARRVVLLASLVGVPVRFVAPPYTSVTCSSCGSVSTFRRAAYFRCQRCGFTHNADQNAARNLAHRACDLRSHERVVSSLHPGGGEA